MKLTQTAIKKADRQARETGRPIKLFDGGGLYLLVKPNGSKLWRVKYRMGGVEKLLAIGSLDEFTVEEAREERTAARKALKVGIDPSAKKQAEKVATSDTFKAVAEEWLSLQKDLSDDTVEQYRARFESYLFPELGSLPIRDVTPPVLLATLRRIEARGRHETAHRARAAAGRVLRYAIATGRAERDASADLKGALAPIRGKHHAALIDPRQVGTLLHVIEGYQGHVTTYCALRLAPLVFVRPGELRAAEWSEFDLNAAEWRIPAERMKMDRPHIVPLSRQAVKILREIASVTAGGKYVFPSIRDDDRPMSENTVNAALRRLGYTGDEMTGHGFRTVASTLLNEKGIDPDVIERQLAHKEQNKTRAAYNRAERLPERRKMMQLWADYLDQLRNAARKEIAAKAQQK